MNTDPQDRTDGPEQVERTTDSAVPPTQQLPSGEVPAASQHAGSTHSGSRTSDDPLAVFDEPVRSADPAPAAASGQSTDSGPDVGTGSGTTFGAGGPGAPLVRSGPRTTTIVWGLIVVAIGVGLLARSAGATIDVELAAILLLGVAGLLLVVGSVAGGVRRRRRTTTA